MGKYQSKLGEDLPEHTEIFQSTGHVEIRLVEKLYDGVENETLMAALCTVFDQEASTDPVAGTKCWTQDILTSYFVTRNLRVQDLVRDAGPLLFKIALHYGSFPFPSSTSAALTLKKFLIFVAMCSNIQSSAFVTRDYVDDKRLSIRSRPKALNLTRILFQSISSGTNSTGNKTDRNPAARSDADDEDLLDVLVSTQPRKTTADRKFNTKTRTDLQPVAASLPSSCSAALDGTILRQDLETLIRLLVTLSLSESGIAPPEGLLWREFTNNVVDAVAGSFVGETESLTWERFASVVSETLPHLLDNFTLFIENTFQVPHDNNDNTQPWPIQTSEILTPTQISLMKFTTGSLLRDFNKLSLSSLPDNERTYIQALQTPPSLLLLRAHSSLGQELVIGAAIDHAYELVHNAWQPMDGILDAQLFVFSPACVMLASGNAKISSSGAGNDWEIRFEKSGEALVLVKAWKGGRIEIGGEGIRFEMSKMEVWKSHEDMH